MKSIVFINIRSKIENITFHLVFLVDFFFENDFLIKKRVFICVRFSLEKIDNSNQQEYDNNIDDLDSPTSYDENNRPPMRYVDKYVRTGLFGLSARYTVALMAMMGFIVSFGMKCNMSAAKLERNRSYLEHVSKNHL